MPKVSIIIPAYNSARYLAAALDSVIAQTFTDWEIVIIDGGSSDGTLEVADRYVATLRGKCGLLHQPKRPGSSLQGSQGISAARNIGIRHSSGEYVAFLDSDDMWLPHRLERTLAVLEGDRNKGLAHGRIAFVDVSGALYDTPEMDAEKSSGQIARRLYCRQTHVPCLTVTVRRACLEAVGLFDERLLAAEDRDMWLRIAERYEVGFVNEVIALYRTTPNSASSVKRYSGLYDFIQKHYRRPGYGFWERRLAIASIQQELAQVHIQNHHPWKALAAALKMLYYNPAHAAPAAGLMKRILTA